MTASVGAPTAASTTVAAVFATAFASAVSTDFTSAASTAFVTPLANTSRSPLTAATTLLPPEWVAGTRTSFVEWRGRLSPGAGRDGKLMRPKPGARAMKMKMSEYSGSAFIKINDLADGPERKTIANVEIGRYDRPVLTFTDHSRLSVNVTNNKVLVRAFGDDGEAWVGQKIELYAGKAKYQDGETDSVLVRPISPPVTRKSQLDGDSGMSDDIPFN